MTPSALAAPPPSELGFRWPAEWEPQKQAFLGWPSIGEWFRNDAGPVQEQIVGVARALSEFQEVTVCANPHQVTSSISQKHRFLPASVVACPVQTSLTFLLCNR